MHLLKVAMHMNFLVPFVIEIRADWL